MKRMKTLLIYVLILVGFYIISNFLIEVAINSTYKPINYSNENNNNEQIQILQSEATLVNGRIKGFLNNTGNSLANKFLKLQLFSEEGNYLGTRYVDINELGEGDTLPFDLHFKVRNVKNFIMEIVDQKPPDEGLTFDLMPDDLTKADIVMGVLITLMLMG